MGSLMSGWSCRTHDPKKVKYMRNKSMTQAEIDAYWKTNSKTKHSSSSNSLPTTPSTTTTSSTSSYSLLADHDNDYIARAVSKPVYRSASMPIDITSSDKSSLFSPDHSCHFRDDNFPAKENSCWWMASRWAFLNEPPVLISEPPQKARRPYNYTSTQSEATVG